jgi:hypothetical protein
MNLSYFDYLTGLRMTSQKFNRLFDGPPRKPESPLTPREMDIARSIQEVTEEILMRMVRHVKKITGQDYLCLAGGVALNSVANGKILRSGIFKDIWIQPAAGDAGGALGAAYIAHFHYKEHSRVVNGKASINLDSWMIPAGFLKNTFARHASLADISIIEGVMGLYDSRTPTTDDGSTAEVAKILDLPVILVVDASAMARSAAALVKGFVEFDPEVRLAGVIFNNVGSPGHYEVLEKALSEYTSVLSFGGLVKDSSIEIPSRHLGLFMGEDGLISRSFVETLSALGTQHLHLDSIKNVAVTTIPEPHKLEIEPILGLPKKIGIASDRAFCFPWESVGLRGSFSGEVRANARSKRPLWKPPA